MGCCPSKEGAGGGYSSVGPSGRGSHPPTAVRQDVTRSAAAREAAWRSTGVVGLRDANLRALPPKIFTDPNIAKVVRNVDASNNRIGALPPSVGSLRNIQRLTLSSNLLETIPPELCACVALKVLVLDRNRIAEWPSDANLAGLVRLQTLSLAHNNLRALPTDVGALVSLATLNVKGNRLAALPTELGDCGRLEALDASDNGPLTEVPSTLGKLTRLTTVHLDNTQVAAVSSEVLTGCTALVTLSLHGCPIRADMLEATPGYAAFAERMRGEGSGPLVWSARERRSFSFRPFSSSGARVNNAGRRVSRRPGTLIPGKHSKKIHGGAMVGSRGLDDGVDHDTTRDLVVPHT